MVAWIQGLFSRVSDIGVKKNVGPLKCKEYPMWSIQLLSWYQSGINICVLWYGELSSAYSPPIKRKITSSVEWRLP